MQAWSKVQYDNSLIVKLVSSCQKVESICMCALRTFRISYMQISMHILSSILTSLVFINILLAQHIGLSLHALLSLWDSIYTPLIILCHLQNYYAALAVNMTLSKANISTFCVRNCGPVLHAFITDLYENCNGIKNVFNISEVRYVYLTTFM